jgi:hypothetical protein
MSDVDNGGPAFPQMRVWNDARAEYEDTQQFPGMTLRDWFAGQALACVPLRDWSAAAQHGDLNVINSWAICAYAAADAMLAERAK